MAKSRKGMSSIMKLVVVFALVIILIPILMKGWQFAKSGVGALPGTKAEEEKTPTGPVLSDRITVVSAEASGFSIIRYPYSAVEGGDYETVSCGGKGCPLVLTFDRNLKEFTTKYFLVEEYVPGSLLSSGYWTSPGATFETLIFEGNPKKAMISGFENGKRYFVKLYTNLDYVEENTGAKYKLNDAGAAFKFQYTS